MRFLSEAEIRTLADAIDPFLRPLILTAGYTGMRFGELAGLRVKHLKQLERSISVEEGMTDVRGKQSFGPLKTKASRRTVSIPQFLVDVLAEHLAQREGLSPDDLVFVSEKGGPLRASNIRRRSWEKAVEATVGTPCRFHDLRHSHAALLIKAGVHPKVIQKRMGHSSIRTTLDTYGHVYDELDQVVALALDESWNKLSRQKPGELHRLVPTTDSSTMP
jgi:integrase